MPVQSSEEANLTTPFGFQAQGLYWLRYVHLTTHTGRLS